MRIFVTIYLQCVFERQRVAFHSRRPPHEPIVEMALSLFTDCSFLFKSCEVELACSISGGCAPGSIRLVRKPPGLVPVTLRNAREKFDWDEKPADSAISDRGR